MPDEHDDDDPIVTLKRSEIRAMEKKANKFDEAESRAAAAERQLAFAKAGIDISNSKNGYFIRGYDGDLDPDAIKTAAIADGFLEDPAKAPQPAPEEAAAFDRMEEAEANGGLAPTGTDAAAARVLNADSEEAFWAEAQAAGLAT